MITFLPFSRSHYKVLVEQSSCVCTCTSWGNGDYTTECESVAIGTYQSKKFSDHTMEWYQITSHVNLSAQGTKFSFDF